MLFSYSALSRQEFTEGGVYSSQDLPRNSCSALSYIPKLFPCADSL